METTATAAGVGAPAVVAVAGPTTLVVDQLGDLTAIFRPDVDVVRLTRALAPGVAEAAAVLAAHDPEETWKAQLDCGAGAAGVARTLPRVDGLGPLLEDLALVVDVFETLLGTDRTGLRVATNSSPMCPAFHHDHVMMRLVVTYQGPGTEYLDEPDVERRDAGPLVREGASVHQAGLADLVLLKGSAWPGNDQRGAVHRSPPHRGHAPRVVATLDPLWKSG